MPVLVGHGLAVNWRRGARIFKNYWKIDYPCQSWDLFRGKWRNILCCNRRYIFCSSRQRHERHFCWGSFFKNMFRDFRHELLLLHMHVHVTSATHLMRGFRRNWHLQKFCVMGFPGRIIPFCYFEIVPCLDETTLYICVLMISRSRQYPMPYTVLRKYEQQPRLC